MIIRRIFLCAAVAAGFSALAGTAVVASGAAPAGDVAKGRTKAQGCIGCHGIEGWRNAYPAYNVPKLGGQHADYITSALKSYQAGTRTHSTMHAIAAGLSDQDMADLAAYFASLKAPQRKGAPAAQPPDQPALTR